MSRDIFISIDFEDFSHDLSQYLGLHESPPLRVDALWKSYERIQDFLSLHGSPNVTFFCTGVLAEKAPDLIASIAKDGHEIACHYYFHDNMNVHTASKVRYFAEKAKDVLESACGSTVIGFRAPRFSIKKHDPAHYQELSKIFRYDSSWFGGSLQQAHQFLHEMNVGDQFNLFPIFSARPISLAPRLRLGGSYLKLFPLIVSQRLLDSCVKSDIIPHIYLHPYEFVDDKSFALSKSELAKLGFLKASYWMLRQHQWNTIGNSSLASKLCTLTKNKSILGNLRENLFRAVNIASSYKQNSLKSAKNCNL